MWGTKVFLSSSVTDYTWLLASADWICEGFILIMWLLKAAKSKLWFLTWNNHVQCICSELNLIDANAAINRSQDNYDKMWLGVLGHSRWFWKLKTKLDLFDLGRNNFLHVWNFYTQWWIHYQPKGDALHEVDAHLVKINAVLRKVFEIHPGKFCKKISH